MRAGQPVRGRSPGLPFTRAVTLPVTRAVTLPVTLVALFATVLVATVLVATVLVAAVPVGARRAAALAEVVAVHDPTPRPLGPITVFGDSVLKGSLELSPSIVDRLAQAGWGPIQARAGGSYSTGEWLTSGDTRASYWIDVWRSQGWDAPAVVIHLGANDAGICRGSLACARRNIEFVLDRLGPGHRVWWPMITHRVPSYAVAWNAALAEIAAERDDFSTWDWPTVFASNHFPTPDQIHLDGAGYRTRAALMANEVTADLARGERTGGAAALPAPAGAPSEFVPLASTRALDTRVDGPSPVPAGGHVTVDVSGLVPPGATAVAAYVSATGTHGPGHLTAWACGTEPPRASAANYLGGQTRGAVTIAPLTADGRLCLATHEAADLLVDVQGAFVPDTAGHPGALRLLPLDTSERLLDTRVSGRANPLVLSVPPGADGVPAGVLLNLTVVGGPDAGYLVAYPCDAERPHSAAVNHGAGEAVAGAAFVPVAADGTFCVWSKAESADVVVDVTATLVRPRDNDDRDLRFVPVTPTRTVDTRDGTGGWAPVHGQRQVIDAPVAPPEARAVSGTLTLAGPARPGYLRAWGCAGTEPATSSVNAPAGATLANFVTVGLPPVSALCVRSRSLASTVFDTTGWWIP